MIDYRGRARRHYDAATGLIAAGDDESLLYACLRLRFAIEALAHGQVQLYRRDLDPEVLADWRANRVLRELAALDPAADGEITIQIDGPDGKPGITFVDHRITSKWISKAYPTLGGFLHERTLTQLEKGGEVDRTVVLRKLGDISDEIARVLNSTGWDFRIEFTSEIPCPCGKPLILKAGGRQRRARSRCSSCGLSHLIEVEWLQGGSLRAKIVEST